jgi:hypothetical protein
VGVFTALHLRAQRAGEARRIGLLLAGTETNPAFELLMEAMRVGMRDEQPLPFQLILSRRTASAIGVEFPRALLLRADEVIE